MTKCHIKDFFTNCTVFSSEETHGTGRGIFVKANIASHSRESILYQSWCRFWGLLGDGDGTITLSHLYQWPAREYSIILRIFADDCLHYWKINFIADAEQLQIDLKSIKKCTWERQMEFHPRNVQSSTTTINNKHLLLGHTLESVSSVKYVGITLNNNLNWMERICNIQAKSCKTQGISSPKSLGILSWRKIYCLQYNSQFHLGVCSDSFGILIKMHAEECPKESSEVC